MMGRMLIPILILALLAPAGVLAGGVSFGIRLVLHEPVRVETLGGGIAGTGTGGAWHEGTPPATHRVAGRGRVLVAARGASTVTFLPVTRSLLDGRDAAGYDVVTILIQ